MTSLLLLLLLLLRGEDEEEEDVVEENAGKFDVCGKRWTLLAMLRAVTTSAGSSGPATREELGRVPPDNA